MDNGSNYERVLQSFKNGRSKKRMGFYHSKSGMKMDNIITKEDARYPKLLLDIGKRAPKQLYWKGAWDETLFENCLAVVGTRHMTSYGRKVTEQLVSEIAL